jgi:alpha-beta hydrolase superfamily lysophospholipase
MVDSAALRWVNTVSSACVNSLDGQITAFEAQGKLKEKYLVNDPLLTSPWRELIRSNSLLGFTATMPNLVFQGSRDVVVRPDVTATAVRNACKSGATIKFVMLPGQGHSSSAKASVATASVWMRDRFSGKPAPSNCK